MLNTVRRTILQVNSAMPILLARTMDEMLNQLNTQPRLIAQLCTIFGLVALLLASTGLYGVLSYLVSRRTNEIGIRMAIGAEYRQIIAMIFRETGVVVGIGMTAGVLMTMASTRLVASRLYGLQPIDPATIFAALFILGIVGIAASYLPAVRAARVNPVTALRYD